MIRLIYLVHECTGRTRLRIPLLRSKGELAEPLADGLAGLDGMEEVKIRPFTGSVLSRFDPWKLDTERILHRTRDIIGDMPVVRSGEHPEFEDQALAEQAAAEGSKVARALVGMVKGMNLEMLRATGGSVDLGTLAAAGFLAAGVTEIVRAKKVPMPPWFNLGWWAFRTFSTVEKNAIEQSEPILPERSVQTIEIDSGAVDHRH